MELAYFAVCIGFFLFVTYKVIRLISLASRWLELDIQEKELRLKPKS